jgi:hypothetical protein
MLLSIFYLGCALLLLVIYVSQDPRISWSAVVKLLPAPETTSGSGRVAEYLDAYVGLYLRGHGAGRFTSCLVSLEPGGIRIRTLDGGERANPAALVPWTAVHDFQPLESVYKQRGSGVVLTLAGNRGSFVIQDPAGTAAWVQWRMVRAHGSGTPIVAAESEQDAPIPNGLAAARMPALGHSGGGWRPSELPRAMREQLSWVLLALGSVGMVAYAGVTYFSWPHVLLVPGVSLSAASFLVLAAYSPHHGR